MPTASLSSLLAALADQIRDAMDTAMSSEDFTFQVEPRRVFVPADSMIDIYLATPARSEDGASMGDIAGAYRIIVRARITGDDDATQDVLTDMHDDASAYCVAAAILSDPTLNGHAYDLRIEDFTGILPHEDIPPHWFYGTTWTLLVLKAES